MGFWSWLFGDDKKGGTRIEHLQVTDVIDGDTIHVDLRGTKERLRFCCIDTEESQGQSGKPITKAGKMASEMAKEYFKKKDGSWCHIDIEFETDDLEAVCLDKHRDKYGRLICYIHRDNENFNLRLIQEGWSPYFVKYGYSRIYHEAFKKAEEDARGSKLVIWNEKTNAGGPSRDYDALLPWWWARGKLVQVFRDRGGPNGALDVREDYEAIVAHKGDGKKLSVFCDLQGGINAWPGDGAVLDVGSKSHPFSLWIPDAKSEDRKALVDLIEDEYKGRGKGFAYIHGEVSTYKDKPQIVITDVAQIKDTPD